MTEVKKGSCHCGAVMFEVKLQGEFENPRRCNCSLCRRKGAIMSDIPVTDIRVIQGENKLTLYQWNTKVAKHYFCSICGIYTHHKKRSASGGYGFNIACIEGVQPFNIGEVPVANGASMTLVEEKII